MVIPFKPKTLRPRASALALRKISTDFPAYLLAYASFPRIILLPAVWICEEVIDFGEQFISV